MQNSIIHPAMNNPFRFVLSLLCLTASIALVLPLRAAEPPALPAGTDPLKLNYQEQKKLPNLPEPYVSTAPQDLGDGLKVGKLDALEPRRLLRRSLPTTRRGNTSTSTAS